MSNDPKVWIRQGYNLALAGEPIPMAIEPWAAGWMQIGHDLAGRLADAQIEETGTIDAMPLPAWPELAQQTIEEHEAMGLAKPQTSIPQTSIPETPQRIAREAQRQAEDAAEHAAGLVRELNSERKRIAKLEDRNEAAATRIEELKQQRDRARRELREEAAANRQLRGDYDALLSRIAQMENGPDPADFITRIADMPGSPRVMLFRAGGNPDAITVEIVSPGGHVYAGANGRTPAAALAEALQRYERARRGDTARPREHPDAGQEAEEARRGLDIFRERFGSFFDDEHPDAGNV